MLEIAQLKLPCGADRRLLEKKIQRELRLPGTAFSWRIVRHSVDARKKPELYDVYSAEVELGSPARERRLAERLRRKDIRYVERLRYRFPHRAARPAEGRERPVVIGLGPAGLFCALMLAEHGYRPIVLERGEDMESRIRDVRHFWRTGELRGESNIQFGEGGAGTFSDGKLTTNVRDPSGRNAYVLEAFVEAGAPEDICYENLPHIGTDRLREVIVRLRKKLTGLGGEVRFASRASDFQLEKGAVRGVVVESREQGRYVLEADTVILAPGHSARDTIRMLLARGVQLRSKHFAVGVRVSHPQSRINEQQYGVSDPERMRELSLPSASYKLTATLPSGRGVYSFCMCPGGYVVNASSVPGCLAVNGMSDYARDSERANSAIVVTVGEEEFGASDPLAGLRFQEQLERKAWDLAGGRIPVETCRDFIEGQEGEAPSGAPRELSPKEAEQLCLKGLASYAPLHTVLPPSLQRDLAEGLELFERKLPGFTGEAAYVCGLESRTSSPVRIERDEAFFSSIRGLIPCGEGAGYAGGIMSAAIDGIKAAERAAEAIEQRRKANA